MIESDCVDDAVVQLLSVLDLRLRKGRDGIR